VNRLTNSSEQAWGALLSLARQGDAEAFDAFYQVSADWALLLARRTVDEAQAEEFMARLYLAAWAEAASFDADSVAATAWLTQLAQRLAEQPRQP
jgi:DNA-directed RNA polymerase specialized sigma24 family protein